MLICFYKKAKNLFEKFASLKKSSAFLQFYDVLGHLKREELGHMHVFLNGTFLGKKQQGVEIKSRKF